MSKVTVVQFDDLSDVDKEAALLEFADRENVEGASFFKFDNALYWFSDEIVINGEILILESHEQGIYLFKDDETLADNEYNAERKQF